MEFIKPDAFYVLRFKKHNKYGYRYPEITSVFCSGFDATINDLIRSSSIIRYDPPSKDRPSPDGTFYGSLLYQSKNRGFQAILLAGCVFEDYHIAENANTEVDTIIYREPWPNMLELYIWNDKLDQKICSDILSSEFEAPLRRYRNNSGGGFLELSK